MRSPCSFPTNGAEATTLLLILLQALPAAAMTTWSPSPLKFLLRHPFSPVSPKPTPDISVETLSHPWAVLPAQPPAPARLPKPKPISIPITIPLSGADARVGVVDPAVDDEFSPSLPNPESPSIEDYESPFVQPPGPEAETGTETSTDAASEPSATGIRLIAPLIRPDSPVQHLPPQSDPCEDVVETTPSTETTPTTVAASDESTTRPAFFNDMDTDMDLKWDADQGRADTPSQVPAPVSIAPGSAETHPTSLSAAALDALRANATYLVPATAFEWSVFGLSFWLTLCAVLGIWLRSRRQGGRLRRGRKAWQRRLRAVVVQHHGDEEAAVGAERGAAGPDGADGVRVLTEGQGVWVNMGRGRMEWVTLQGDVVVGWDGEPKEGYGQV